MSAHEDTEQLVDIWRVYLVDGAAPILNEELHNGSMDARAAFTARVREHVKPPKDEGCANPDNQGQHVGELSWYGGPLAARAWSLHKCKACGGVHGRLTMMA